MKAPRIEQLALLGFASVAGLHSAAAQQITQFQANQVQAGDAIVASSRPGELANEKLVQEIGRLMDRVDERLESRQIKVRTFSWSWDELEHFENQIWRAMALDPARLDSKEIPEGLDPVEITHQLRVSLGHLKASRSVAESYRAAREFDDYVNLCDEIIGLREKALYRQARLVAKKGLLEENFQKLSSALESEAQTSMELSVRWAENDRRAVASHLVSIEQDLGTLKERIEPRREPASDRRAVELAHKFETFKHFAALVLFVVFSTGFVGGWLLRRAPSGSSKAHDEYEIERTL
jgi:hypothetical protein